MNAHEKRALRLINNAMSDLIGGYENTMEDFAEGSEEYEAAEQYLTQGHEGLVKSIYDYVMAEASGTSAESIKFVGTDTIEGLISAKLKGWGY